MSSELNRVRNYSCLDIQYQPGRDLDLKTSQSNRADNQKIKTQGDKNNSERELRTVEKSNLTKTQGSGSLRESWPLS